MNNNTEITKPTTYVAGNTVHPDDTPSRHPGKLRVTSDKKRFLFAPYNVKVVLGLDAGDDDDDDEEEDGAKSEGTTPDHRKAPPHEDCSPSINSTRVVDEVPAEERIVNHSIYSRGSSESPTPRFEPVGYDDCYIPPTYQLPTSNYTPACGAALAPVGLSGGSAGYEPVDVSGGGKGGYTMIGGTIQFALVRFKMEEKSYYIPPSERHDIAIGDLVVVEGDRGENIGTVIADLSMLYHTHDSVNGKVVRRALNRDRKKFFQARRREVTATSFCADLVAELQLSMSILDTEFQTDGKKLTIYYRCNCEEGQVDFRQLQRLVFKHYRCRVWLVKSNVHNNY